MIIILADNFLSLSLISFLFKLRGSGEGGNAYIKKSVTFEKAGTRLTQYYLELFCNLHSRYILIKLLLFMYGMTIQKQQIFRTQLLK